MQYQWILLDLDNTILDFDTSSKFAFRKAFTDLQIPYKEGYPAIYHRINHQCWVDLEQGIINQVELRIIRMEAFFKEAEIQGDDRAFGRQYLKNLSETQFFMENALAVLDYLNDKYTLAIITNGLKEVQRPHIAINNLEAYFETIVVSDEIGASKPQAAFYDYVFQQIGHPDKKEVLAIGDSLSSDILGGINYGIDTCWFNFKQKEETPTISARYTITSLLELKQIL